MHCRLLIARVFCLGIALLGVTKLAPAALIVDDDFGAIKHPSAFRTIPAAGLGGIPWYLARTGSGSAAIITESGAGTFNSEFLSVTGFTNTSTPVIGLLGGVASLANTNDTLSLDFSFRFLNGTTATGSNANFRFGFHNSAGTSVTADGPVAVTDNDTGYYVQIGNQAQTTNNLFYRENGGITLILSGTDRAAINSSGFNAITDNAPHTGNLTLTRTNATTITLSLAVDGGTPVTTTTTTLLTSFDEITFGNGFSATNLNYGIDNVVVNSSNFTAIPEPSTIGFAVAGLIGGWAAYRRRKLVA